MKKSTIAAILVILIWSLIGIAATAQKNEAVKDFVNKVDASKLDLNLSDIFIVTRQIQKINDSTYLYNITHKDITITFTLDIISDVVNGINGLQDSESDDYYLATNKFLICKDYEDREIHWFVMMDFWRSENWYEIEDITDFKYKMSYIRNVLFRLNNI